MRAYRWRLLAACCPILVAVAACADETVSGLKGVVTLASRGTTTNTAVVTRPSVDPNFGSSVQRSGVTGVTVSKPTATVAPSAAPIYRALLNLTVKGAPPGQWHDTRLIAPNPSRVYLVPELQEAGNVPQPNEVTQNSLVSFSTMRQGTYHMVYSDEDRVANPEVDAQGYQHLDMLGFFVTNAMYFKTSFSATSSVNLDLFWETLASPNSSDARAGDDAHANGQYTTYQDTFKTRPYTGPFIDALPDYQKECKYRFVVKALDNNVVWQSEWHQLDPAKDPDFITVAWNGYSSRTSGPKDAPPDNDPNNRLAEGTYLFAIEFYPVAEKPPSGPFRATSGQGTNFVSTYYGASQWFTFQLKHGIKPSPSPAPGSSPAPSPSPSVAPTSQPSTAPSQDAGQISL